MHTLIPAIAEGPAGEILAFGVMGGHYQAAGKHGCYQKYWMKKQLQAAIDAPRVFNYPDALYVEDGIGEKTRDELTAMGHTVKICVTPLRRRTGRYESGRKKN